MYRITDLEAAERPRERLAKHGPQVLSSAELLAILLRVGVTGENAVQVGQRLLLDPTVHSAERIVGYNQKFDKYQSVLRDMDDR
jgi:DNA repair protein RadC